LKSGGRDFSDDASETEAYREEIAIEAELAAKNEDALRELVDYEILLDADFRRSVRSFFAGREQGAEAEAPTQAQPQAQAQSSVAGSSARPDAPVPSVVFGPTPPAPPTPCAMRKERQRLRPKERLSARQAMRGGRTEGFFINVDMKDYPDYNLYYLDMVSQYPAKAMQSALFPVGEMKTLISRDDISRLEFCPQSREEGNAEEECGWGLFYRDPTQGDKKRKVHGAIQCKVLPPCPRTSNAMTVQYPVLPVVIGDKSIRTLCRTCAQLGSREPCAHTDDERCLVASWTILDILCAIAYDYKVLEIYEVYAYFETAPLFRDYISLISSFKIRFEGFPAHVRGNREAEAEYCRRINEKMNFTSPGVLLTPDMMCANEAQRNHCKTLLNSLLGKTAQRAERIQQLFMMSQSELDEFFFRAQSDVLSWQLIDSNVLYLRAKKKGGYAPPNRTANCLIGGIVYALSMPSHKWCILIKFFSAYVTALGRVAMQQAFCKIHDSKGLLLYTDTGWYYNLLLFA
jgi:hypothetical protein